MITTSCDFRFGFWDLTARQDAHFQVSQNKSFADILDINIEDGFNFQDVATLEPSFGWPLDGSKELLPNNAEGYKWGWWSEELAGEDLNFEHVPTLTVDFYNASGEKTVHSSAGITFYLAYTLPKLINVKWYGYSDELLKDADFQPDKFEYFADCPVENYSKVVISVLSMSWPYRYLRMTGILFGLVEVLEPSRIVKARLTEENSPAALSLPASKMELSFYSPDGQFALLNPTGKYQYFQWRQQLTGFKTINGERKKLGTYFLSGATATVDAITSLTCLDSIGILTDVNYWGGIYSHQSVRSLLGEILGPEGLSFELAAEFNSLNLSGYLPPCSKREALRQIAFALGASVDTSRVEKIRFYPAAAEPSGFIGAERKVMGHKVSLGELVTRVDVTAHQYTLSEEIKELARDTFGVGEHLITFAAPAVVTSVTGAVLVNAHVNFCTVNVVTAGEVYVNGKEYVDTETICTVKTNILPAGAKESIKTVTDATLLNPDRARAAAQRLYNYYQMRYKDEGQILPGWERPGEMDTISSLNGRKVSGYIEHIITDLTGGGLETISLRGKVLEE